MKKITLSLAIALSSYCSYAQNSNPWPASGDVTFGTDYTGQLIKAPQAGGAIQIKTNSATTDRGISLGLIGNDHISYSPFLSIGDNGRVGIGTTSPSVPLHVSRYGNNVIGNMTLLTTFTDPTGIKGVSLGYNQSSQAGIIYSENNTGTGSPLEFWTYDGSSFAPRMVFTQAGKLGLGTTSPSSQLDVFHSGTGSSVRVGGNAVGTASDAAIDLYANNANNVPTYARIALGLNTGTVGSETGYLNFSTINAGTLTEKMRLTAEGNILIGKTSEQPGANYKLDIAGSARANEIVVNTSGADFVFDKKYSLPKLSDVKAYIDQNHHLPEIPSAKEMQTNGLELGEMNKKLLQKVEELTLYLIDKDKQDKEKDIKLSDQQQNMKSQQAQIDELRGQLKSITKRLPKN